MVDTIPPAIPTPSTSDTFAIPFGAPSEPMKTRIVEIDEHSEKLEGLAQMHTYDSVVAVSSQMTHGAIVGMVNWCRAQGEAGTTAKWQFRRFAGIPLPYVAFIALFIVIYGLAIGWSTDVLIIGSMMAVTLLFIAAFASAEYKHDARDICLICGTGTKDSQHGKPIYMINPRTGRKVQITRSGYCDDCAWNVFRKNLWTAVEASIWNLIRDHPVRVRRWWRMIGYQFFWWMGYQEECVDPRPVGRGQIYRKKDRWDPKDDIDENQLDNIIKLSFTIANLAQRAKRLRRKI